MDEDNNTFMGTNLKRVGLCTLPTPLVEAPGLSAELGGTRILIKRDDLIGLALGGNKSRSLEYILAEAISQGVDIVLAIGPQQSNWLCSLTAASQKLGVKVILFLLKGNNEFQGNLLLNKILGADIRFTDIDMQNMDEAQKQMENLAIDLRNQGHTPYILNYGPVPSLGIAGYISLALEICNQLEEKKINAQHLFVGSGSGCTQAGLILGSKLRNATFKIHGIMLDPRFSKSEQISIVANEANDAAKLLGIDLIITPEEVICHEGYSNYKPTDEVIKAIKIVAQREGFFLDPAYTGKVMAAMMKQIHNGKINPSEITIFYHSGGIPNIFNYKEMLSD
jgi:1-aminocyclopropane-1-carboxylate deaminase/D-cysteine desulfhydrase-like pyridoxal-dependent ACC family enzyme